MEEAWSVPDVYLLTDGPDGAVAVPNLTLTFLPTGLALDKSDGDAVWHSAWSDLAEMSAVERSLLPDGRDGVAILVVERGEDRREHRFVLATADPAETASAVRGRAAAHGLRTTTPRSPVSKILTIGIVLLALATLTVLLLSAAHVFTF
jgi:hypothetical protein